MCISDHVLDLQGKPRQNLTEPQATLGLLFARLPLCLRRISATSMLTLRFSQVAACYSTSWSGQVACQGAGCFRDLQSALRLRPLIPVGAYTLDG